MQAGRSDRDELRLIQPVSLFESFGLCRESGGDNVGACFPELSQSDLTPQCVFKDAS
jgi:hypothetical protein